MFRLCWPLVALAEVGVRLVLAALLGAAGAAKLARPREAAAALPALVSLPAGLLTPVVAAAAALELALAAAVVLGSAAAAFAAAALLAGFALVVVSALLHGRGGAPCPCFGARGRIGWWAAGRNALLAAGFAGAPFLSELSLSTDAWLGVGLGVALGAVAGLTLLVLALAREIGVLRLQLPPQSALELESEGPAIGRQTSVIERFAPRAGARFALAVFSSESCHLCRSLTPAVRALAHDPLVAVHVFDEVRDQDVWQELEIPGSPYAVALGLEGTVRAKGTFNSFAQLESVLAAAERREPAVVGA